MPVHLAVTTWSLHLEGCASLKEKRSLIKPLVNALRRGNASVAETGHQDVWQRAEVACAVIGSDRSVVEHEMREADRIVEEANGVRIVESETVWR